MRLTFLTVLLLCSQLLVCQITSFPHTQDFEQVFTTGTNVDFIANWQGNEVGTTNRIFQGTDARSGTHSINIIPTSTFTGEILVNLDMSSLLGGKISFYAYSKENGATSTRPAMLNFSTSINGGAAYLDNTQIGNDNAFPNDNSTSYTQYEYEMPEEVAGESNVIIKIEVSRGDGTGSVAELVMDDFFIEEQLPALAVTSMTIIDNDEIQVQFNQDVETSTAETRTNYRLNFGFENPSTANQDSGDASIVNLTFSKAFVNNTYELTIDNVENIDASSIASGLSSSDKYETQTFSRQLVINEIYADPTGANSPSPSVLPNTTTAEYIELFNTTNEAIEITDFDLSGGTIGTFVVPADDFVILTSTSNEASYQGFGNTVAVSSWNTLTNAGEQIALYDQLGNLIDSLTFNIDWYQDAAKADGGWSLEQINPELACSGSENWSASISGNGGTPALQNSLFDNSPDIISPSLDTVIINTPTSITLVFDELMDEGSVNSASYSLTDGVGITSVSASASLRSVDLALDPSMTSGTIYTLTVNGVTDCSGNVNTETTTDFLFDNEAPVIERYVFKSSTEIDLIFDEPVVQSTAENEINYSINSGIGSPNNAELNPENDKRTKLELDNELSIGGSYQITLNDLQDSLGNTSVNQVDNFIFENDLDTVIVISSQLLDVYFQDDLNASAADLANYDVEGIGNPVSANIDGANLKLIHLAFDSNFPQNTESEIRFENIQNSSADYLQALNTDFIYDTDDPDLTSIEVIDANNLQINFDEVLDQSSAEIINHYTVNNGIGIPATATLTNSDSSVLLNFTTNFEQEVENELTYTSIEDLSGNAISSNRNVSFTFDTRPPRFDRLIVYSPRELLLSFSEEVVIDIAEDINSYSVDNGIGNPVLAVRQDSATNKVLLTFTSLGNNSTNTLTISSQRDLFTNDLSADITVEFSSLVPSFGNFRILSDTSLQIQYTKEITTASAEDIENYGFDNGIGSFSIDQDDSDFSKVNIYLTTQLEEDRQYRLVVDSLEDVFGNMIPPSKYDFTFTDHLTNIEILSTTSIRLNFDKVLDESLAETISNYVLDNGIGMPASALLNPSNTTQVTLTLSTNLIESTNYQLSISGLKDEFDGIIPASTIPFVYDVTPPVVTNVNSIYYNEIEVVFDEVVDPTTALALNHYSVDGGIGQPIDISFSNTDQNAVTLTMATELLDGENYILTLERVEDTQGKAMSLTNVNFSFEALAEPGFRDILLNEIYFDVDANSGLPPYEYIELLNNGGEDFQLREFQITDGNDTATFKTQTISNSSYLLISNGTGARELNGLALSNFPSLSNNGETVYLLDRNSNIIDSLAFNKSLYNDETREDGGYSIELINPNKPCFDSSNYSASVDANGGTPGAQNSVFDNSADVLAPGILEMSIISTSELLISFDEAMDISSLLTTNFNLRSGVSANAITIQDTFGKTLLITLDAEFDRGLEQTLEINGVQDCSGNVLNTSINFELGALPQINELLITEIMATPTPVVGLPELEYVEIYNNSAQIIALNDVYLADNAGRTNVGDINIDPQTYLILTKNSSVSSFTSYGDVLGINSFPTFTKQDEARLENADSSVIFSVSYSSEFFKDEAKENGGYSLEMIRLNPACQSPDNWAASTDPTGGSPGQQNSIFEATPDSGAPSASQFEVLSDTTFLVQFSEAMDVSTLINNNFIFSPSLTIEGVDINDEFGYSVTVEITAPFDYGLVYDVSFSGITDCAGNVLNTISFEFAEGRNPLPYELIITEIMANPSPVVGLPESEYVEIYNTSSEILSLDGVVLADAVNSTTLPDTIISPGQYMLLVPNSTIDQFASNTLGLFNWPNLNADEETLRLFNTSNEELFSISYSDSWYRSTIKSQGGYSLEMIDLNFPCVEENNWSASEASQGGSPGVVNSINGNNPDNQGPELVQAVMIDEGSIQLSFSERLNPSSIEATDFTIDNGLSFIAHVVNEGEKTITLYTSADLSDNVVYTINAENITDCSGNLIDANAKTAILIVPAEATIGDILVNEVLFNPRPGSSRFIEFYNTSNKFINLKDWRVAGLNNNRVITESDLFIEPNSYFGVTDDVVDLLSQYPATVTSIFIELSSMPSMRDSDGAAILLDPNGLEIDRFNYDQEYHSPLLSDVEGVSLERIRFSGDSDDENNWFSASSADNYATPGYLNSQNRASEVRDDLLIIDPKTFSPEVSGTANFTTFNYKFDDPGNVLNITIYDAAGNLVKRVSQNKLIGTNTFFTWDGTREDGSRVRIGYYMVLTEIINADGRVQYIKDKVAIGGRF